MSTSSNENKLVIFRNKLFYTFRPYMPRRFQLMLRRAHVKWVYRRNVHRWPIDYNSANGAESWNGWPNGKRFALVLTHDVDTARGQERCLDLMKLEQKLGFRSSFNFVPERYKVSEELRKTLKANGFEVGVHGLNHDGKLYFSRNVFLQRAKAINGYLQDWDAVGFRSPAMHHDLDWIHDLNILYDCSTFDTDPFEPQSDGMGTIFPFLVKKENSDSSYVELPYTLPQDFTLYILLREKNPGLWCKKLDWIIQQGGMALLNVHPDYMDFTGNGSMEEYSYRIYEDFLTYLKTNYKDQFWHVLPKEMAEYSNTKFDAQNH